jgi:hypothetical protein
MLDAREQAFGVRYELTHAAGVRTVPVRDDRFRIDYSEVPVPISATSSGREHEWPQIGIGFGMGVILMLGLYLAVRYTRIRPLPH